MRVFRRGLAAVAVTVLVAVAAAPLSTAAPRPASGRHTVTVVPVYSSQKPDPADIASMLAGSEALWTREVPGMSWSSKVLPDLRIADPCSAKGAQKALETAAAKSGVNVYRHGAHLVVYIPECNPHTLDAAGRGLLGDGSGWLAIFGRDPRGMTLAHELGHNLGLNHSTTATCKADGVAVSLSDSCTTEEYGNLWGVMGSGSAPAGRVRLGPVWQSQLTGRAVSYTGKPTTLTLSADGARGTQAVRVKTRFGTVYLGALLVGDRAVIEAERVKGRKEADADRLSFPDATGTRDRSLLVERYTSGQPTQVLSDAPDDILQIGSSWAIPGSDVRVLVTSADDRSVTVSISSQPAPRSAATPPVVGSQVTVGETGTPLLSWTPVPGAAVYLVSTDAGVIARTPATASSVAIPVYRVPPTVTVSAVFPDGATVTSAPVSLLLP